MEEIVTQQRNYFNTHVTKSLPFRIAQLKKLERVLKSNESLLYDAIYKDFKKSSFETYATELALIYQEIREVKRNLKNWARVKRVSSTIINFPSKSYIIPEPLGVCLVIGSWNYPYQMSLAPAIAALAAGNTVVLKPSELPSGTSAILHQLISENFDPEYFTVVEGGIPETTQLLKQKFDKIFFTGSTTVGKIVYKAAAENLTPVTLELGGKSPAFVTKSCNLKMTVKRLIWGKFLNAGQTCIAPDYVLVDQSIEQKFLQLAKDEIEKEHFNVANGNYSQIINKRNVNRLKELIDTTKIYCGGKIIEEERYIEPTILYNVTFGDKVMQEEIFGPILPVISYTKLEEAIAKVKLLPKPLACYIFTNNSSEKKKVLQEISFGGGAVNDNVMHITNPNLPFGGIGNSGMGNYHGEAGFKAFSHYKSVLEKSNLLEFPLKYFPQTKRKLWWIKQIFKL